MIHQPVIPKIRLDRQPFSLTRVARSALSLFEVPREQLLRLPAPSRKFDDAVNTYWVQRARKNVALGGIVVGSIDALVTVTTFLPIALSVPAGFPIVAGIWTALQVGVLPLGIAYSRVHRAEKRNFNAFLLWLKGRYGVTLSAKQGLPKYLRSRNRYEDLIIVTSEGVELRVQQNSGLLVTERNSYSELPVTTLATPPKQVQVAPEMTPEAKALCDQLGEHLTVLTARSLSPESTHVVERATRDRKQIVALHADLVHLNALDGEQEAAIVHSFTTLLSELKAVVQAETAAALTALSVENTYITARKERGGIALHKEGAR